MEYPLTTLTERQLEALVTEQWTNAEGIWFETFTCPECGRALIAHSTMRDVETPLRDRLDQHVLTYCAARVRAARRQWDEVTARSSVTMARLFPRWGYGVLWDATHRHRAAQKQLEGDPDAILRFWTDEADWLTNRFKLFCEALGWPTYDVKIAISDAEGRTGFHLPPAHRRWGGWHSSAARVAAGLHSLGMTEAVDY